MARALSGKESTTLGPCFVFSPCYNTPPINPDFDRFGGSYFAFSYPAPVIGTGGGGCLPGSLQINFCGSSIYDATGNDIFALINDVKVNTTNNGNTDEVPVFLAADPNGRSLYILGTWSKRAADSKFSFGSSQLTNPGGMILRYRVLNSAASPVPVFNLMLTGKAKPNENILTWNTTSERENDRFELQRSTDGRHFGTVATIATTAPQGNSDQPLNYEYSDKIRLEGVSHYRIKQVDKNGKYTYSNGVSLNNIYSNSLAVYPNPAGSYLNVLINAKISETVVITIIDANGRSTISRPYQITLGSNAVIFDLRSVPSGAYLLKVSSAGMTGSKTTRFRKL